MYCIIDGQLSKNCTICFAGTGASMSIFVLLHLGNSLQHPLLMAPFGASCVLLFLLPNSPLSQTKSVIGGHLLSSTVGLLMVFFMAHFPVKFFGKISSLMMNVAVALSVGLAISLMGALNIVHPPAGANPIVILLAQQSADFQLFPGLSGAVILVLIALSHQKLIQFFILKSRSPKNNSLERTHD